MSSKHTSQQTPPERRRGRPRGHNRQPLSEEERRARNAQYERERRGEQAEASAELANAMGCEAKVKLAELLALTIMRLKRGQARDDVRSLRMRNEALEAEIAELQAQLNSDCDNNMKQSPSCDEEETSASVKRNLSDDEPTTEQLPKKIKLSPQSTPKYETDYESASSPSNHSAMPPLQIKHSPQSTTQFEADYESTSSQNHDDYSQGSATSERLSGADADDILLSSEELVELESLMNNKVFADGIQLWSSTEDIDFTVFPPTT